MARVSKKQQKINQQTQLIQQKKYMVGIYARLSVDNHNEKNESIETQIDIAKAYMRSQAEFELYQCYVDLGVSGASLKRDGFEQLMEDIVQEKINCIIVKDFSRLGRNYIEVGNLIQKIFPLLNVRFISVTDGFDSYASYQDEFSMNLKNLVNEMYAKDIAAKVKSTRKRQRENGNYMGSYAPYGYGISSIGGKRILIVEKEAAAIVKNLFCQYEKTHSYKNLIQWLYINKVHRPSEYRKYKHVYCKEGEVLLKWSRWTIQSILTNSVYIGYLTVDETFTKGKKNTHQAIIDSKQFFNIAYHFERQSLLRKKKNEKQKGREKNGDCSLYENF